MCEYDTEQVTSLRTGEVEMNYLGGACGLMQLKRKRIESVYVGCGMGKRTTGVIVARWRG